MTEHAPSAPDGPAISTEDVLTPIHKALRSMIYQLGGRLQTTDFADPAATAALLADIHHEFGAGVPASCILCLLHAHGGHEDTLFPEARPFDAKFIDELMEDHRAFGRALLEIERMGDALQQEPQPVERLARGRRLAVETNGFFARYLAHMNREERYLVPLLNRHFTDEQLRGMRERVERGMPRERLAEFHRWMLGSLDVNELTALFQGVKAGAPPEVLAYFRGLAEKNVDPARWKAVRARVAI